MREFDFIDGIRVRALRAAWKPDNDAVMRRIFRWYSEKFHTPLHQVEDLPVEDVLLVWFETQFEAMEVDERHNLAIHLLETEDERRHRLAEVDDSDAAFMQQASMTAAAQLKKKELKKKVDGLRKDTAKTAKNARDKMAPRMPTRETELPSAEPSQDEVVVSFADSAFEDVDFLPTSKKG